MSRRKVSTAARIAALVALTEMRPRVSFTTLAGLADGAADLAGADHPPEVVDAIFAGLRLSPEQCADLRWTLGSDEPEVLAIGAGETDAEPSPEMDALRRGESPHLHLHPDAPPDTLEA